MIYETVAILPEMVSDSVHMRLALYHVYRQLMGEEEGKYAAAFAETDHWEQTALVIRAAEALHQNGLSNHASHLLQEKKLLFVYTQAQDMLSQLEHIDPDWGTHATFYVSPFGCQLIEGEYSIGHASRRFRRRFSASIIYQDFGKSGGPNPCYEICPTFDGKGLEALELVPDDIIRLNSLEEAVAIAHAVSQRDEPAFRHAVESVYLK